MTADPRALDGAGTPAPGGRRQTAGHHRLRIVKGLVALVLLGALSWLGLVAAQYFRTGEPIASMPMIPQPVAKLLQEPAQYLGSIDGIAEPLGIAVGPDGRIYVTEGGGDRTVRVFDETRAGVGAFAPDSGARMRLLTYPAVSPAGEVYVPDRAAATIYVFSGDGQLLRRLDSPFGADTRWFPLALAFDRDGNLYVTETTSGNHRVLVLDQTGALLREIRPQGTAEEDAFSFPNGVAVDGEGRVYVADSNNGRVEAFNRDGVLLYTISRGTSKGDLGMPRGLAVDNSNHLLFVVDTTGHAVQVYDISGKLPDYVQTFGEAGVDVSAFLWPNSLAITSDRHVYITDRGNNRVQIWRY